MVAPDTFTSVELQNIASVTSHAVGLVIVLVAVEYWPHTDSDVELCDKCETIFAGRTVYCIGQRVAKHTQVSTDRSIVNRVVKLYATRAACQTR